MTDEDLFELDNVDDGASFQLNSSTHKNTTQPQKRQIKAKVCSEWSDHDIFKLISCVECMPVVWNAKDDKYRNKIERQSAWKQMSEIDFESKYTDSELMAKWSNLRIQYRSYYAKCHKTKSGQGVNEQVKWKFYEAMYFIGHAEQEQTASTVSNLINTDDRSPGSPLDQSSASTPLAAKRRRLSQSSSVTTSSAYIVAEGMKDAVNQLKEKRRNEDEFDAFGKYIASELRSLSDPKSAQRVRFQVARCLMDNIEAENQSVREVYVLDGNSLLQHSTE